MAGIDRTRRSDNHGPRLRGPPDALVLHYTGMVDGPAAVDWLCNPASQVSCHYVVAEDGTILQLVDEDRRAWHAGRSTWGSETDLNSASIGIEIVNGGHAFGLPPYPEPQIAATVALCRDIVSRNAIRPERVLAHSDVAPSRKQDPGERFPWGRLAAEGIGHWVKPSRGVQGGTFRLGMAGQEIAAMRRNLAAYGYALGDSEDFDRETKAVVAAFQRHFRPALVDGEADADTRETLRRLIRALEDRDAPPRVFETGAPRAAPRA